MANLKNITELPVTNFTESLKLIVNDSGATKQLSVTEIKATSDSKVDNEPLILDAELSEYYGGNSEMGDAALEAIKTGRPILVKVPSTKGGNYVVNYSPISMYQVPTDGMYLYLFYLRDEKQDLSASLGQPAGTILLPTYGEFMMLLSQYFDSDPLEFN